MPSVIGLGSSRRSSAAPCRTQALMQPDNANMRAAEDDGDGDAESFAKDYGQMSAFDIASERAPWLAIFCVGLIIAAGVVEEFDELIAQHVELSFFVPLIMGHGGNAGAQTTCAVVRALALKQVSFKQTAMVVGKETAAGLLMGSILGMGIFTLALGSHAVKPDVAAVVALSMPAISLWANGLGALLTLVSAKLRMDPAMTSAPLVTTIVDSTALMLYFHIAKSLITDDWLASVLQTSVFASLVNF